MGYYSEDIAEIVATDTGEDIYDRSLEEITEDNYIEYEEDKNDEANIY